MATRFETRDLPFLRVAADRLDQSAMPFRATQLADETGLTAEECVAAARALLQGGYLEGKPSGSMQGIYEVILSDLTERGRRAVGIWPTEDTAEAFEAALLEVADRTKDPEQAGRLRRIAREFAGMTRELMVEVGAAAISRATFGG